MLSSSVNRSPVMAKSCQPVDDTASGAFVASENEWIKVGKKYYDGWPDFSNFEGASEETPARPAIPKQLAEFSSG